MGCVYKGYCSDMTRTFFYECILEEEIKVYEIVKKANEAAEAMIKPGVKLSDIDKCARTVLDGIYSFRSKLIDSLLTNIVSSYQQQRIKCDFFHEKTH